MTGLGAGGAAPVMKARSSGGRVSGMVRPRLATPSTSCMATVNSFSSRALSPPTSARRKAVRS